MASEKVEFLKARLRNTTPSISLDRARLVTKFYETPSVESPVSRKAHLLEYLLIDYHFADPCLRWNYSCEYNTKNKNS